MRIVPNNDFTMDKLFYVHKEVPSFIECKKRMKTDVKKNTGIKIPPIKTTSFGTSFF